MKGLEATRGDLSLEVPTLFSEKFNGMFENSINSLLL